MSVPTLKTSVACWSSNDKPTQSFTIGFTIIFRANRQLYKSLQWGGGGRKKNGEDICNRISDKWRILLM